MSVGSTDRSRQPEPAASGYRALALAQLQRVAGLDTCEPALLGAWVDAGELMHLPRGAVICRRGQPCDGLLLVVEGALQVGRYLGQPDAHVLTYLGPGDVHGLVPIVDGGPQLHDMIAHEAAVVLLIPLERVQATLAQHPAVREAFEIQLAQRNRIANDRLYDAVSQPLSYRLARHLDFLGQFFGAARQEGVHVVIRVSQADLAHALGASRQQVNVELKKFEQRGLISLARGRVVIRDPQALLASGYSNLAFTQTRGADAPAPQVGPGASTADAIESTLRGRRVLLVDDDPVSRMVLAAELEQSGVQVDHVDHGAAAVELACAAAAPYTLIVMDEHMPGMSGSEATRRIRAHERAAGRAPTPILGVSSDAGRDDTRRFIAAGMNAHLAKPIRSEELLAALHALLV